MPSPSSLLSPIAPSTTTPFDSPDPGVPQEQPTHDLDDDGINEYAPAVSPATEPQILNAADLREPPPPYPHASPRRSRRARRQPTSEPGHAFPTDETTPLLASPRLLSPNSPVGGIPRGPYRRRRTMSGTSIQSVVSVAPSLAQTVVSLFADDYGSDDEENETCGTRRTNGGLSRSPSRLDRQPSHVGDDSDVEGPLADDNARRLGGSMRRCRKYFRPLGRKAYYAALFHLLVLNFPYAVLAWVYLFVFTLTGTALLITLPLGAVLCFFNALGARALARGELALQTRFHGPLALYPAPPNPIFTRPREPPADADAEMQGPLVPVYERSFYRNTYSMFTDSTTYRALFYFLVIKPGVTLLLTLLLIVFVPPCAVLILPAPGMLRAVRKLGIWQANVAVEGLYTSVS